ncbi:MAG TPA: response regulator [Candidatus Polarisedimenticolia bacterium]|nr:response regulator [Candidatus Polarisedimenticolia bacterium]
MTTILLIDDSAPVRKVLRLALESESHRVTVAAAGPEGVSLFRKHRPAVTIVDIMMPEKAGGARDPSHRPRCDRAHDVRCGRGLPGGGAYAGGRNKVLRNVLTDLANTLRDEGIIDERESFIDATFASAKGGGKGIGPTKRGKGVKIMGIVDRNGLPLAVSTHAANHHEVTLVQLTFEFYMIEAKPENRSVTAPTTATSWTTS